MKKFFLGCLLVITTVVIGYAADPWFSPPGGVATTTNGTDKLLVEQNGVSRVVTRDTLLSGIAPLTWRGAYSAGTAYQKNSAVQYSGSTYVSTRNTTAGQSPDSAPAYWQLLSSAAHAEPHAATHAAAGSDPLTLSQSQVTGLTTALAGKQSALTNASTLGKIGESWGAPTWNGGAWPGGGGGGGDGVPFAMFGSYTSATNKRLPKFYVEDPRWSGGAKGDGTTCDDAAFQAVINYVEANSLTAILELTQPKYKWCNSVRVTKGNIAIKGAAGITTILRSGDFGDTLKVEAATPATQWVPNVHLSNLTFKATGKMTSGAHVDLHNVWNLTLDNLTLLDGYGGLLQRGGLRSQISNLRISGNRFGTAGDGSYGWKFGLSDYATFKHPVMVQASNVDIAYSIDHFTTYPYYKSDSPSMDYNIIMDGSDGVYISGMHLNSSLVNAFKIKPSSSEFTGMIFLSNFHQDADTFTTKAFTGTGLDDMKFDSNAIATTYDIVIDGTGTPNTFKYRLDGGSYTTGVAITGSLQTLSDGFKVIFGSTTGHTLNDKWTVTRNVTDDGFLIDGTDGSVGNITISGGTLNGGHHFNNALHAKGNNWTSVSLNGVRSRAGKQYGVNVEGTLGGLNVSGGHFHDNETAAMRIDTKGAHIVGNNIGVDYGAQGTGVIFGSNSQLTMMTSNIFGANNTTPFTDLGTNNVVYGNKIDDGTFQYFTTNDFVVSDKGLIVDADDISATVRATTASNTAATGFINRRALGRKNSELPPTTGTLLGQIAGRGWNGSSYFSTSAAAVKLYAGSLFSGTNQEGYIDFETAASGATTSTPRMRLTSAGRLLTAPTLPTDDGTSALQTTTIYADSIKFRGDNSTMSSASATSVGGAATAVQINSGSGSLYGDDDFRFNAGPAAAGTKGVYLGSTANTVFGVYGPQTYGGRNIVFGVDTTAGYSFFGDTSLSALPGSGAFRGVGDINITGDFKKNGVTIGGGGSGTVTSVTSANGDITITDTTVAPVITLNSGSGANQIPKLDANAGLSIIASGAPLTIQRAVNGPGVLFKASQGTTSVPTAVTSGQVLANFQFAGGVASNTFDSNRIGAQMVASENWSNAAGATTGGMYWNFLTRAAQTGASTMNAPTTKFSIMDDGRLRYQNQPAAPATNHAVCTTGDVIHDFTNRYTYYCHNGGTDDGSTVRWSRSAQWSTTAW